ncbi:MAG TPA: hypothetical protein VD966_13695 [Pyrinomonadaceae bacterium]|nr:hypothetical protein [Pyrinomonadaceae bacterium]
MFNSNIIKRITPPILAGLAVALYGFNASLQAQSLSAATSNLIPLYALRSNDCTGEIVELSGTIHLVSQQQPDGSIVGHFNYQQVRGVGLTSGVTYRVSTVDHFRLSAPFPSSITSVGSFHLISQGPGGNLLVHDLFRIAVNANGEITVSIDDLSLECR